MSVNPSFEIVTESDLGTARHYGPRDLALETQDPVDLDVLPACLRPDNFKPLPSYTLEDVRRLRDIGYDRLGVAVMLYDHTGQIVIGKQTPSAKNPEGVWSLLSETTHFGVLPDGSVLIEDPHVTALRCIKEELGPASGTLRLPSLRAWQPTHWPVGSRSDEARKIIAPLIPMQFMPGSSVAAAVADFSPTPEISEVRLVDWPAILDIPIAEARRGLVGAFASGIIMDAILNLRHGVLPFMHDVNLLMVPRPYADVNLDALRMIEASGIDWHDAVFSDMPL